MGNVDYNCNDVLMWKCFENGILFVFISICENIGKVELCGVEVIFDVKLVEYIILIVNYMFIDIEIKLG